MTGKTQGKRAAAHVVPTRCYIRRAGAGAWRVALTESAAGLPHIREDALAAAAAIGVRPCSPTLDTLQRGHAAWRMCDARGVALTMTYDVTDERCEDA